jgi:hypothetical protein
MYLIYDKKTSRILSKESKSWQQAAYKTMSAAQAALTRMQKKFAQRNAADAAQGPLYTAAIAEADYYYKNIEKFVTRKNMMTGKEYTESINTPSYMSPSSESYWSM